MRFSFTPDAELDIDEITSYLQDLPKAPALRIGRDLQKAIYAVCRFPGLGRVDERLTRLLGVLPGERDIDDIMRRRLR
jgi:plasmid stabilization system protein ParE